MDCEAPPAKRSRLQSLEARVSSLAFPTLWKICSLAVDSDGTIFVGTESALYTISPAGRLALLAGSEHEKGFRDGQGSQARFNIPRDLAVGNDGCLYVADTYNHRLRRVSPHGTVKSLAGSGEAGFADGVGENAQFHRPRSIAFDGKCTIYVSDHLNHCIRTVNVMDGAVTTLCGSRQGESGYCDGAGAAVRFWFPTGICFDIAGMLIAADYGNHCIRKVSVTDGTVTTVAGSTAGGDDGKGFADGDGTAARFHNPSAVAVDGNNHILVTDRENHRLRMIVGENARVSTLAGTHEMGKIDGEGVSARFDEPWALAVDERGRLLVAELGNMGSVRVVEASLAPTSRLTVEPSPEDTLKEDFVRLLQDTKLADVTFAVGGKRFAGHRCVLAARSPYFHGMFECGMREEGSRAAGEDIALEEVSADAFEILLRFLYAQELPENLASAQAIAEIAQVADRFQAKGLYEHCLLQFRTGLLVSNVVERLMCARDSGMTALEESAIAFFKQNANEFHSEAMPTLSALKQRPDHMDLAIELMTIFASSLGGKAK